MSSLCVTECFDAFSHCMVTFLLKWRCVVSHCQVCALEMLSDQPSAKHLFCVSGDECCASSSISLAAKRKSTVPVGTELCVQL